MKTLENKTQQEELTKTRNETVMLTFMKRIARHDLLFLTKGKDRDF